MLLSDTVLFNILGELGQVVVTWTADSEPRVVNDIYTICTQLVLGASPLGTETCVFFGPF